MIWENLVIVLFNEFKEKLVDEKVSKANDELEKEQLMIEALIDSQKPW